MGKKYLVQKLIKEHFPGLVSIYTGTPETTLNDVARHVMETMPEVFEKYSSETMRTYCAHAIGGCGEDFIGLISKLEYNKIKINCGTHTQKVKDGISKISYETRVKCALKGVIARGEIPWTSEEGDEYFKLRKNSEFLNKDSELPCYKLIIDRLNDNYHGGENIRTRCSLDSFYQKHKNEDDSVSRVDWRMKVPFMGGEFSLGHVALFYQNRRAVEIGSKNKHMGTVCEAKKYLEKKYSGICSEINYSSMTKALRKIKKNSDFYNSEFERMLSLTYTNNGNKGEYIKSNDSIFCLDNLLDMELTDNQSNDYLIVEDTIELYD
jgi:hypothetical protein